MLAQRLNGRQGLGGVVDMLIKMIKRQLGLLVTGQCLLDPFIGAGRCLLVSLQLAGQIFMTCVQLLEQRRDLLVGIGPVKAFAVTDGFNNDGANALQGVGHAGLRLLQRVLPLLVVMLHTVMGSSCRLQPAVQTGAGAHVYHSAINLASKPGCNCQCKLLPGFLPISGCSSRPSSCLSRLMASNVRSSTCTPKRLR